MDDSTTPRITFADDSVHRVISNRASNHKTSIHNEKNAAAMDVEEAPHEGDFRRKQEFHGATLIWLAYQSIGVIYGDIGTSPLYVYSSTFSKSPSYDDLVGALSLIIWTLTLIVTVKYICIVLNADDEGEGGTFALYSLLSRFANIVQRDPKELVTVRLERYRSFDLKSTNKNIRASIEKSPLAKIMLKVIGVLGVSLVMADGVLTPPQSILGAIQGLEVVKPDIQSSTIVGSTCGILVLLFAIQPLGTSRIASAFAPIVIIWLSFNFAFGIYNLVIHDHSVLKAFSPYFAGHYLVVNKTDGWKSLGGILLAFTGVEALFADLGAFTLVAAICLPMLLAYIGQAAYISVDPTAASNPFFKTVPPGMIYPSLVISILAAIVASQAMITSTFQLLSQFYGQIYIPMANWLLMIGAIVVTAVYSNTTRIGNAYGVCVVLVTSITTCMVSMVALIVWRLNIFIVLAGFLVFGSLDGLYLSSALTKIPNGAWFTIVLAAILSSIFILWRYGKEQQWGAERHNRSDPRDFITSNEDGSLSLMKTFGGAKLTETKGMGIFFDKSGSGKIPTVFSEFVFKFEAYPEVMVFFHMQPLSVPITDPEERFTISRTSIPNAFRFSIRHGYTEDVVTPDLGHLIYTRVEKFIHEKPYTRISDMQASAKANEVMDQATGASSAVSAPESSELGTLHHAFETQVVYIVGKEQMRISEDTNFAKRIILATYLWIRENTRGKVAAMHIPVDRLVEVGFVKEL